MNEAPIRVRSVRELHRLQRASMCFPNRAAYRPRYAGGGFGVTKEQREEVVVVVVVVTVEEAAAAAAGEEEDASRVTRENYANAAARRRRSSFGNETGSGDFSRRHRRLGSSARYRFSPPSLLLLLFAVWFRHAADPRRTYRHAAPASRTIISQNLFLPR